MYAWSKFSRSQLTSHQRKSHSSSLGRKAPCRKHRASPGSPPPTATSPPRTPSTRGELLGLGAFSSSLKSEGEKFQDSPPQACFNLHKPRICGHNLGSAMGLLWAWHPAWPRPQLPRGTPNCSKGPQTAPGDPKLPRGDPKLPPGSRCRTGGGERDPHGRGQRGQASLTPSPAASRAGCSAHPGRAR